MTLADIELGDDITLGIYAHEFEKQRTADDTRSKLADGFGHLLAARS
jgi:hypothetical protein